MEPLSLVVEPHPLLDLHAVDAHWPQALGDLAVPAWIDALTSAGADTPFSAPDAAHDAAVRALLRHGGFKPAGRSKPCSEYIRREAELGKFPRVDPAVDLTNAAALHGALPVSTIDVDRAALPLRVGIAPPGASYVFNASGQVIDLGGLVGLADASGWCANAVKDAMRTKTTRDTRRTLTIVWGTTELPGRAAAVAAWLVNGYTSLGARVATVAVSSR